MGVITRVAGTGTAGNTGDDGPAIDAQLHGPAELKPATFVDIEESVLLGEEAGLVEGIWDHGRKDVVDANRLAAGVEHFRLTMLGYDRSKHRQRV